VSSYGNILARKKYTSHFKETLQEIEKSERFDKKVVDELQLKQLRQLVKYAYENVPYYNSKFKANGIAPDVIQTIDDIKKIPILTKEEIRANSDKLISSRYSRFGYDIHHTSGTTGTALSIVWSKDATMKEYAFVERIRRRTGDLNSTKTHITFGGRLIVPLDQKGPPFWRVNRSENQYLFSMHHLKDKNLPCYIKKIRELKPWYIEGYPSLVYVVAEYMIKNSEKPIPLKGIFTSSETLLAYQRRSIEKAFHCKVFDRYGSTELAASMGECELGGLHIDSEYGIIEFLENNEEVSQNEVGEMVCTNFINPAFPLIRYKVGDIAKPTSDLCSCGRTLPLVKEVIGRIDDVLITKNGAYLGRLDHIFKETIHIKESQIIQESIDRVIVRIVPRIGYSNKDSSYLLDEFRKRLGDNMEIEIEFVNSIHRQNSGKFKAVISKVKMPLNDRQ